VGNSSGDSMRFLIMYSGKGYALTPDFSQSQYTALICGIPNLVPWSVRFDTGVKSFKV